MTQAKTWVGLDVHVSGTVAAVLDRDSGELRRQRLSGRAEEIAVFVAGVPRPGGAADEGGATGVALARRLRAARGAGLVGGPGVVSRGPRRRVQTHHRG